MSARRTAARSNLPAASSSTTTTVSSQTPADNNLTPITFPFSTSGTLHLRAEAGPSAATPSESERRIHWAEDVVNNEGMGKKSSKVCCIYHKPRAVGESSDESSSDSSSDDDSDSGNDSGAARPTGRRKNDHDHGHSHEHDHSGADKGKGKKNAYEEAPKNS